MCIKTIQVRDSSICLAIPATQEIKVRGWQVQDQPRHHSRTLSQKTKTKTKQYAGSIHKHYYVQSITIN